MDWSTTMTTNNDACIPIQNIVDYNRYALTLYRGYSTSRNDFPFHF
jgi:hypothetical protein